MDRVTSYGDMDGGTAGRATTVMEETARHYNNISKYAQVHEMPLHSGDTLKFKRYADWAVTDSPLSETIDPTFLQPTFEEAEVTVEEYGQAVQLTRKIKLMHEDPLFQIQMKKAGKAAAQCSLKVDFNALKAGTNVSYAGTATTRVSVDAAVSNNALKKVVRQLEEDGIEPISEVVPASTGIGTEPVPEAYRALVHTHQRADLEALEGWLPVHAYPNQSGIDVKELGECEGIRFIANREAPIWKAAGASSTTWLSNGSKVSSAASADVYPIIVIGQDSWARVPLAGTSAKNANLKPIVLLPKPQAGDVLGRRGSVAWCGWFAALITWEDGVHRLETAVTAL